MKLDRSKKYEGLGLTLEAREPGVWASVERTADDRYLACVSEHAMQAWLNAGWMWPVKETKIVRVHDCVVKVVTRVPGCGQTLGDLSIISGQCREHIPDGAVCRPVTLEFEVDA